MIDRDKDRNNDTDWFIFLIKNDLVRKLDSEKERYRNRQRLKQKEIDRDIHRKIDIKIGTYWER